MRVAAIMTLCLLASAVWSGSDNFLNHQQRYSLLFPGLHYCGRFLNQLFICRFLQNVASTRGFAHDLERGNG